MSETKTIREQIEQAVSALAEACKEVERNVFTPDARSYASCLGERDKRMWVLVEVLKNNAELFAAAEETATQLTAATERAERAEARDSNSERVSNYKFLVKMMREAGIEHAGGMDLESTGFTLLVAEWTHQHKQLRERVAQLEAERDAALAGNLPEGAVLFVLTGETREPQDGEWYRYELNHGRFGFVTPAPTRDKNSDPCPIYRCVEAKQPVPAPATPAEAGEDYEDTDDLEDQSDTDDLEMDLDDMRTSFQAFASYVVTCRLNNQSEWMRGLAEKVNEVCERLDERDRFAFDGDCLLRNGQSPSTSPAPPAEAGETKRSSQLIEITDEWSGRDIHIQPVKDGKPIVSAPSPAEPSETGEHHAECSCTDCIPFNGGDWYVAEDEHGDSSLTKHKLALSEANAALDWLTRRSEVEAELERLRERKATLDTTTRNLGWLDPQQAADYRKSHEAWEAVKRNGCSLVSWKFATGLQWYVKGRFGDYYDDPRDAVLALSPAPEPKD